MTRSASQPGLAGSQSRWMAVPPPPAPVPVVRRRAPGEVVHVLRPPAHPLRLRSGDVAVQQAQRLGGSGAVMVSEVEGRLRAGDGGGGPPRVALHRHARGAHHLVGGEVQGHVVGARTRRSARRAGCGAGTPSRRARRRRCGGTSGPSCSGDPPTLAPRLRGEARCPVHVGHERVPGERAGPAAGRRRPWSRGRTGRPGQRPDRRPGTT
jgi:hypothetical protein